MTKSNCGLLSRNSTRLILAEVDRNVGDQTTQQNIGTSMSLLDSLLERLKKYSGHIKWSKVVT